MPYIQNYSIEFSRISGYYTKKKTAKRLGPFQISVAEIEVGDSDGKEQGSEDFPHPMSHQHDQSP